MEDCDVATAVAIYEALVRQHAIDNVWLFLDGFTYEEVPDDLMTFRLLATSQLADLTSQERDHAYCILHSCWRRDDLAKLAKEVYKWNEETVSNRFFYSGGSVREFTRPTVSGIRRAIEDAVKNVDSPDILFSGREESHSGNRRAIDRLRHTFVKAASAFESERIEGSDPHFDRYLGSWEHVVDSEFAVRFLSSRWRVADVEKLFLWARAGGEPYASLSGHLFKLLIQSLASYDMLELYGSPYDQHELREPRERLARDFKRLAVRSGTARRAGTVANNKTALQVWRDDHESTYWFPEDSKSPNVDAIIKLKHDHAQTHAAADGDVCKAAAHTGYR